jgi:hypothetical protein
MKSVSSSKSFTWFGVALFYLAYLLVLLIGQEFHPWLTFTFLNVNLQILLFNFLPVLLTIYLFKLSQRSKIFVVCAALVFAPMFLVALSLAGINTTRLSFALNWPVYTLLAGGRDNMTIPRDTGEVFLGGGWNSSYIYNANDKWWDKYLTDLQAYQMSKKQNVATQNNASSGDDQDCRIVTPLIGHWYLEYQQYGGGFVPCEGIAQ